MLFSGALTRFGWGPRGEDTLPFVPTRSELSEQITAPDAARFAQVSSTADGLIALRQQRKDKLQGDPLVKPLFQAEVATQLDALLLTNQPFRERLAWFWFNHFTVSLRQGGTRGIVGAYMREAIRLHITGKFSDLLLAVMRHPAMLMYLDNSSSIGPNSPAGLKRHRGLNENLARECLELHTLSPAGGYTQNDVTQFAAILTGWGVDMQAQQPGFSFHAKAHEPGPKTLMGKTFPDGEEGGLQALHFLGTHPATYRHIATQMVQHFIADTPDPADVTFVANVLHDTEGDLAMASLALLDVPSKENGGSKFRTPMDFAVAVMRALSLGQADTPSAPDDPRSAAYTLFGGFAFLGQPLWTAPLPNGWSDRAADWSAPADMMARADWAWRIAAHVKTGNPLDIAHHALGNTLRKPTIEAIKHAGARQDALTLLFTSPEFQRR